jgi:hypothetical protein
MNSQSVILERNLFSWDTRIGALSIPSPVSFSLPAPRLDLLRFWWVSLSPCKESTITSGSCLNKTL